MISQHVGKFKITKTTRSMKGLKYKASCVITVVEEINGKICSRELEVFTFGRTKMEVMQWLTYKVFRKSVNGSILEEAA